MTQGELGGSFKNFHFRLIEPKDHDAVLKILEEYLYSCMEPLGYTAEFAEDYNSYFSAMMKRGYNLSYVAVDSETGEIACCRMVEVVKKGEPASLPIFKHKWTQEVFELCDEICKDEDLFEKYGITEYADMFGLCTVSKYRQQGLAGEMYSRGLDFLKKRGFQIVKCGFISPFTRQAGLKHGYKAFASRTFLECRDSEGKIFNPNAEKDKYICFGIFDIRNRVVQ